MSKNIHLPSFGEVWETCVSHIRDAFSLDSCAVSAPALRCFKRALRAAAAVQEDAEAASAVVGGDLGKDVGQVQGGGRGGGSLAAQQVHAQAPFTQESLVGFVDVIKCSDYQSDVG